MAFGTMLPTSTPENRMKALTSPTIAPAHRVVAPDSSSSTQAFIDSEPPKPPSTEASRLARPLERNSWSRSAVFWRATSRLDTSSRRAMAITPQNTERRACAHPPEKGADLGAALGNHAPIDLIAEHKIGRPP